MANNIYVDPTTGKMQQGQSGGFNIPLSEYTPSPSSDTNTWKMVNPNATGTPTPANPIAGATTATTPPDALTDVRSKLDAEYLALGTEEDIRSATDKRNQELRDVADSIFGNQITRAKAVGEQREGSATGQLGVSRGLGFSTAQASYMSMIEDQTENSIKEIESAKASYIKTGQMEYADKAEAQINQLRTLRIGLLEKKADWILQERADERADKAAGLTSAATKFNIMKDITKGDSVIIDGQEFKGIKETEADKIDPFYTGSNIIELMKTLPEGEERSITDPNTGTKFTITGLATDDPKIKSVEATDDKGNVTVTRYNEDTGKLLNQISLGKVGKTKTQASNVTLNMNNQEKSDLSSALIALEQTKGEKYNSKDVANQYRLYNQLHPGKGTQFLDTIKGDVNYNDQVIKELYDVKSENDDAIEITTSSGAKIKL